MTKIILCNAFEMHAQLFCALMQAFVFDISMIFVVKLHYDTKFPFYVFGQLLFSSIRSFESEFRIVISFNSSTSCKIKNGLVPLPELINLSLSPLPSHLVCLHVSLP